MFVRILNRNTSAFLLSGLGFALLQALAIFNLSNSGFWISWTDSLIHTFLYALISVPLYNAVKFGKFETLPQTIKYLNYSILLLMGTAASNGLGFWILQYIFPDHSLSFSVEFLPMRLLLSILVYILLYHLFKQNFMIEETKVTETDSSLERTPKIEAQPKEKVKLEIISIKNNSKIDVLPVEEVVCIESDGDYVHIYTRNAKFMKEQTMKYFEENLSDILFQRVHRSYIVNLTCITRIELYDKANQQLTLSNGMKIKISQNGYKSLKEKLEL